MTVTRDLFALWAWPMETMRLGSDLAETMLGAQRVVSARMPAIGTALTDPLRADHRELGTMVTEKVAAFRESGRSVGSAGRAARKAAGSNARAMGRLASGGLMWPSDWMRLCEANLAAAAALAALPAAALEPIHRTVVANDRRLSGPKTPRVRSPRPKKPKERP